FSAYLSLHSFPTRRSSDLFFFCYSRPCCFSAGKHSRDFVLVISAVPLSQRISGGKFFMTRLDSFVTRPGAESALEISNRSLQFLDRKSTRLNSSHVSISYA